MIGFVLLSAMFAGGMGVVHAEDLSKVPLERVGPDIVKRAWEDLQAERFGGEGGAHEVGTVPPSEAQDVSQAEAVTPPATSPPLLPPAPAEETTSAPPLLPATSPPPPPLPQLPPPVSDAPPLPLPSPPADTLTPPAVAPVPHQPAAATSVGAVTCVGRLIRVTPDTVEIREKETQTVRTLRRGTLSIGTLIVGDVVEARYETDGHRLIAIKKTS
ncbi:MAG: hypothetical protein HYV02_07500 [Deltaproteobacteria bacterium]|nr:hypothetical protein [Deltaproteobacteria bacterium]